MIRKKFDPELAKKIVKAVPLFACFADRVHITRETVTRVLRKMREQNEIEMDGRRFKLLPAFFDNYEKTDLYKTLKADLNNN